MKWHSASVWGAAVLGAYVRRARSQWRLDNALADWVGNLF